MTIPPAQTAVIRIIGAGPNRQKRLCHTTHASFIQQNISAEQSPSRLRQNALKAQKSGQYTSCLAGKNPEERRSGFKPTPITR